MKNLNKLTLYEALQMINDNVALLKDRKAFAYQPGSALEAVFKCAFLPECKFDLPDGLPAFEYSKEAVGMCSEDMLVAIRKGRLEYLMKGRVQINPIVRERIFVKLLEGLHKSEANVLIAIKNQALTDMFPNLTYDVLVDAGYLPERADLRELYADTKSESSNKSEGKSEEFQEGNFTVPEGVVVGTPKKPRGRPRKKPASEAGAQAVAGNQDGA